MSALERKLLEAAGEQPESGGGQSRAQDKKGPAPRTFAELPKGTSSQRCRRCGEPGNHRVMVLAQAVNQPRSNGKTVASRSWRLCEPCAVEVFTRLTGALR